MSIDRPTGPRVLLVEDNFVVALELVDRVARLGIVVDGPHASAEQARAACERRRPEAAVLDVRVRGGTSVALGEWLVAQGVAVIFLTGYGEIPDLPASLVAIPTLRKPIDDGQLERVLLEHLPVK